MSIQFVVHEDGDGVGVAVVEGIKAGQELTGWVMQQDREVTIVARNDIPIGHKVALKPLKQGDTVIKYGEDIGRMTADAAAGEHVHVQNLKTKRW